MSAPSTRRLATFLWTDDRHTRIRLQSWTLTLALYVACAGVMGGFGIAGLLDGRALALWLLGVLCVHGVFHGLIRSGWSRRLSDPSMTEPQMVVGQFAVMAGYAIAGELRSAVLMPLLLILTFGALSIPWRRMAALTVLAVLVMGGTMLGLYLLRPATHRGPVELSNFLIGLVSLPGASAVAELLGSMRARLRQQRADLRVALARIQDLATLDDLTGLANRRRAQELLSAEVTRGQRAVHPFAVALVDLDRFKRLNDRFGHAGGDEALRAFAHAAREGVRAGDLVSRWGGEEFLVLMPETTEPEARAALERLRAAVEGLRLPSVQGDMRFTFSAGVTGYRAGQTVADTVARADRALYRAKAAGRNRIELAGPGDEPEPFSDRRSSSPPAAPPATAPPGAHPPAATDGSRVADSAPAA